MFPSGTFLKSVVKESVDDSPEKNYIKETEKYCTTEFTDHRAFAYKELILTVSEFIHVIGIV